jgi:uncharacterized membrane protein YphA (DoxX/SURF4 family)
MRVQFGRHVFGLAAIAFGIIGLVWHDFNVWQQIHAVGQVPHREILVYAASAIEIFGGIAIQWSRTARAGAIALGSIYLIFALLWIPLIIAKPQIFDRSANFFEQYSLVSGALIVYASTFPAGSARATNVARFGYVSFGICVISFTLGQLLYLSATARFVPKWIPPGQMFWAVVTTIAFALAAFALLSGNYARLASQLLTIMILGFGAFVWLPMPFPDGHLNWGGNAENLAIAGSAWIVADFLSRRDRKPVPLQAGETSRAT